MTKRSSALLVLSLCATAVSPIACDVPDDAPAEVRAWPPVGALDRALARPRSAGKAHPSEALTRAWLEWVGQVPWTDGPIDDPTGAHCGAAQDGHVWFLAGTPGGSATRECTIPRGKQLFFPLINGWAWFHEEELEQPQAVADSIAWFEGNRAHTCSLTLRLDGEEVVPGGIDDLVDELWVETYEPFEVTLTDESFISMWGLGGGQYYLTGGGHYARIQPLSPGDHVLELGGRTCDGDETWFETSVTYHLHIGG